MNKRRNLSMRMNKSTMKHVHVLLLMVWISLWAEVTVGLRLNSRKGKTLPCDQLSARCPGRLRCIGTETTPIPPPKSDPGLFQNWFENPNIVRVKVEEQYSIRPELITFDAVNTLIMPTETVGRWYRRSLLEACDNAVRLPQPARFAAAYREAYAKMCKDYPCFGVKQGLSSEDWWRQVVAQTLLSTEHLNCDHDDLPTVLPETARRLYYDVFGTKEGWLVKNHVEYTLKQLAMWRDQGSGPKLGVIANFDERLPAILQEMNLLKYFDFVLTSREVQSEKPDSAIFQRALQLANVSNATRAFHIGNHIDKDVRGAYNAGWNALHFFEKFDEAFPGWDDIDTPETAERGQDKAISYLEWGRKDLATGVEWRELWGVDEILYLFGFPEDLERPIRTTVDRGVHEDW